MKFMMKPQPTNLLKHPGQEEMFKINGYLPRIMRPDEMYVATIILCNNDMDREFEVFADRSLENMAKMMMGTPGYINHERPIINSRYNPRIYQTEVVTSKTRLAFGGRAYKQVKAKIFIPIIPELKTLIENINIGNVRDISIGGAFQMGKCSICGKQIEQCKHNPGKFYNGKFCYIISDRLARCYEWSFVAVGAQRECGIIFEA